MIDFKAFDEFDKIPVSFAVSLIVTSYVAAVLIGVFVGWAFVQ